MTSRTNVMPHGERLRYVHAVLRYLFASGTAYAFPPAGTVAQVRTTEERRLASATEFLWRHFFDVLVIAHAEEARQTDGVRCTHCHERLMARNQRNPGDLPACRRCAHGELGSGRLAWEIYRQLDLPGIDYVMN